MIDGTDCLVNAIADPERTAAPSIAQKIFMTVKGRYFMVSNTEDFRTDHKSQRESDWAGEVTWSDNYGMFSGFCVSPATPVSDPRRP